ncbi:MAG: hypothetical protein Q7W16_01280 [Coriobacteriia bacterium]|nr:hypothetical protein [Coriobacteriia bacterium]
MAMPKVKVWIVVLAVAVAIVMTGALTWTLASSPSTELDATVLFEQHRAKELSAKIESLSSEASAAVAAANAAWAKAKPQTSGPEEPVATTASGKDVKSYVHIRKMTGPLGETFTVHVDPFLVYTGAAATKYAKAHGKTVPSNGILIVDESKKTFSYPLADTAEITAYTGGVEAMTPEPIDGGLLQQWVTDPSIIPDASSDMWEITVKSGVITNIKMVAIAG